MAGVEFIKTNITHFSYDFDCLNPLRNRNKKVVLKINEQSIGNYFLVKLIEFASLIPTIVSISVYEL
jgi:hypothetical protein